MFTSATIGQVPLLVKDSCILFYYVICMEIDDIFSSTSQRSNQTWLINIELLSIYIFI